ncbi:MAG: fasciclin domain-containing protein [Flavobacteriales bacterium]
MKNSKNIRVWAATALLGLCGNLSAQWDFTLYDALGGLMYASEANNDDPCCFFSGYAFQGFNSDELYDADAEYTVFVPNQAAVDDVLELMNLNQWDALGFSDFETALDYHIVPGTWMAADLQDGMSLLTLQGQSISVSVGAGVMIDDANVIATDILADNGVIHVIDATLAPAGYPEATVVQVVIQSEAHTAFEQAISNAFLVDYLSAQALEAEDDANGDPLPGPFTLFAPTDDAIDAFATAYGYADAESFLTSQFVDEFMERHIVVGNYTSTDLSDGQTLTSMSGEPITISFDAEGVSASGAAVETPDLLAYNGVVHSIGSVLPLDIPSVSGTCGTWTINLFNNNMNSAWGDNALDIYVNGALLSSETCNELALDTDGDFWPDEAGVSTFAFAVNQGSTIDLIYNGGSDSSELGYELIDEDGNVIFSTSGDTTYPPGSAFGLKPCAMDSSCGLIEVTFSDETGEGWIGGAFDVYSDVYGSYATIDFGDANYFQSIYPFYLIKAYVPVNNGELGFAVTPPQQYADLCGYIVRNPAGEVIVNQNLALLAPESVTGVTACEASEVGVCNAEFDVEQATTPNGTPIAGAVNVVIYDYNPNASYAWDFGNEGGTSDEPFPTYTYESNGPYTLCLTVTDEVADCTDTFCESISVDSLGLLDGFVAGFVINVIDGGTASAVTELNAFFSEASIYPNPVADWLMVSGIKPDVVWNARLISLTGKVVSEFNGTGPRQLPLSDITPGLYLLQLHGEQTTAKAFRVVIE